MNSQGDEEPCCRVERNSELSFSTVCGFLNILEKYRRNPYMRARTVSRFIDKCIRTDTKDAFEVFRLILPTFDEQRVRDYYLTEHRLIYLLLAASDQADDQNLTDVLYHWRDKDALALALGEPQELSELLKSKLFVDCRRRRRWTVAHVNDMLDRFCKADVDGQVSLLRECMQELSTDELKWLTQILLRNVKVYIDVRDILEEWNDYASMCFYMRGWTLEDALNNVVDAKPEGYDGMSQVECGRQLRRHSSAYVRNIHNAYAMMERRFRDNLNPLTLVVEAVLDGYGIQVHRCGGSVTIFSEDSKPDRYFSMLKSSLSNMVDEGDFVVEAQVVIWNMAKQCFEPRFVLEAVLEESGRIEDGFKTVDCPLYALTYSLPQYVDLEIVILVSDVLYVDDENVYEKELELRLESLETRFKYSVSDRQEGFPLRIKVLPLIPGQVMVTGVPLCVTASTIESIASFRDTVERFGSQGVYLRAMEAEWNSRERLATVVVSTYMGASIVHGIIIGGRMSAGARVEYWDIGLLDGDKDNSDENNLHVVPFVRVKNSMCSNDFQFVYSQVEHCIEYTAKHEFTISNVGRCPNVAVSGVLVPPGRWNATCVVMKNPVVLGWVRGTNKMALFATSTKDLERIVATKRSEMDSITERHVALRGKSRTVAERFLPCNIQDVHIRNTALDSKVVYFINYTKQPIHGSTHAGESSKSTRRYFKESCEKLVHQMGGTVSQSHTPRVDFVVAGHPTIITDHFSRVCGIEVMSISWLKRLLKVPHGEGLPLIEKEDFLNEWVEDDVDIIPCTGPLSPFTQSPAMIPRSKRKRPSMDLAHEPGEGVPGEPVLPPEKVAVDSRPNVDTRPRKADEKAIAVEEINLVDDDDGAIGPHYPPKKQVDVTPTVDLTQPEQRAAERKPIRSPGRPKLSLKERANRLGLGKS